MKYVALIVIVAFFVSCETKQTTQIKNTETIKEISPDVKFINLKGVCNLLSSIGLDQGNFRLIESEAYSNHYICDAYEAKKMTCSWGAVCNEIVYLAEGSKRGVTELNLKYRNYAGADKAPENEKDIQVFITAANILTKAALGIELDDLAKKQILETLTVPPPDSKVVYEKKFNRAVLSIFRSVGSTRSVRVVKLTIFADEYWKDDKNTFMEWGCRNDIFCN